MIDSQRDPRHGAPVIVPREWFPADWASRTAEAQEEWLASVRIRAAEEQEQCDLAHQALWERLEGDGADVCVCGDKVGLTTTSVYSAHDEGPSDKLTPVQARKIAALLLAAADEAEKNTNEQDGKQAPK